MSKSLLLAEPSRVYESGQRLTRLKINHDKFVVSNVCKRIGKNLHYKFNHVTINVSKFKHESLKVQVCYETGQPECIKHPPTKSKNCWWAFANMATVVMDDSDQGKLEIEL